MKSLIKLAVGAAIAGAVVALVMRQRSRMRSNEEAALAESAEKAGQGTQGFTVGELIAAAGNAGGTGTPRPH